MKKEYEIVERPSGYWIELADSNVGRMGTISGPYSTIEEAEKDIAPSDQLQYPLPLGLGESAEVGEWECTHKWVIDKDGEIRRIDND